MVSPNVRDMLGSGLRLILLGGLLFALVQFVFVRNMDLAYPYITPELITAAYLLIWLGYFIPGVLFLILAPFGARLDPGGRPLKKIIAVLMIITGALACLGIIGIRNGVMIILHVKKKLKPDTEKRVIVEGFAAYQLYMAAGIVYLLTFGLCFQAFVIFTQMITIDLMYPYITQPLLLGIQIWVWMTFIVPGLVYIALLVWLRRSRTIEARRRQRPFVIFSSVLSMLSVFGLAIGANLIASWWMTLPNSESGNDEHITATV